MRSCQDENALRVTLSSDWLACYAGTKSQALPSTRYLGIPPTGTPSSFNSHSAESSAMIHGSETQFQLAGHSVATFSYQLSD
jgi:hypothetical protein